MPIGYILIVLAQPFNLFFLTLLVFPVKKRIYSLYVYILHLFTVIQFEIVGCNTTVFDKSGQFTGFEQFLKEQTVKTWSKRLG